MKNRWPEISTTFEHLVDLPEDEQRSELDRIKVDDRELAEAVSALLEADAAGGFPPPPEPLPYFRLARPIDVGSRIKILEDQSYLDEDS